MCAIGSALMADLGYLHNEFTLPPDPNYIQVFSKYILYKRIYKRGDYDSLRVLVLA